MFDFIVKKKISKLTFDECNKFIPDFRYGKVIKVYDGDTITLGTIWKGKKYKFSIRLNGIDTPELRTKNEIEKRAGYFVRDQLRNKIDGRVVRIEIIDYDKYGRILGEVYLGTEKISEWLLKNRYCVKYGGGTKEIVDWKYLIE